MKGVYFDCVLPSFCANCGEKMTIKKDEFNRMDYYAQNSFSCKCGVKFLHINESSDLSEKIKKELNAYR